MSFASAIVSRIGSLSPALHGGATSDSDSASIISSQGTCSSSLGSSSSYPRSLESASSSSTSASASASISSPRPEPPCTPPGELRVNEHLAVLLPKHLWKPDSQASCCDTFLCRRKFTIRQRRHHCRKCGGVFCAQCSSRETHLLDTSNLDFFHPPRDIPVSQYDSPSSPVVVSRVCDDCWDQIHGRKGSRSPVIGRSVTIELPSSSSLRTQEADPISTSRASSPGGRASSSSTASSSSPRSPHVPLRPSIRRAYTSPRTPHSPLRTSPEPTVSARLCETDLGELQAYPLRQPSAMCKASGGGRWEPKPVNLVGYRIPGTKLAYEIELEEEEEEKRRRRQNPLIVDGDFQLRVPKELEPRSLGGPITLSTF
ncbi:hypothetical protein K474DRAFT_1710452 [Panus rudis PR-1116 ss-1]|nr:hypothetical protein K474DRAFT_1710452 [Panus rudis PR-1116 ss-1]